MKAIYTLILSSCILFACNQPKEQSKDSEENIALVKQYFAHFNKHEWDKMAQMYSESADFKDPSLGKDIVKQSRQQTIDKYAALNDVFPNLHDEVLNIYPSGDNHIIVEFVSSGTAPDNSTFELPICTIFTIEKGKITKDFTYFDNFEEEK